MVSRIQTWSLSSRCTRQQTCGLLNPGLWIPRSWHVAVQGNCARSHLALTGGLSLPCWLAGAEVTPRENSLKGRLCPCEKHSLCLVKQNLTGQGLGCGLRVWVKGISRLLLLLLLLQELPSENHRWVLGVAGFFHRGWEGKHFWLFRPYRLSLLQLLDFITFFFL